MVLLTLNDPKAIKRVFLRGGFKSGTARFSYRHFTDSDCAAAIESLPVLPNLKSLVCEMSPFSDKSLVALAHAAKLQKFPSLQRISFDGLEFDEESMAAFSHAVENRGFPHLRTIRLGRSINDTGLQTLGRAMEEGGFSQLRYFGLYFNEGVGDVGVGAIARAAAAQGLPQLKVLELDSASVGDKGVVALAKAATAQGFPELTSLNLSRTRIGDIVNSCG